MKSAERILLFVALAAAAMLGGALASQYLWGLQPCPLCIQQRYALAAAAVLAFLASRAAGRRVGVALAFLAGFAFLTNSGVAGFHSGVELKYWGSSCAGGGLPAAFDPGALRERLESGASVAPRCDDIAWQDPYVGLSMANWNGLISLFLAFLSFVSLRRIRPAG